MSENWKAEVVRLNPATDVLVVKVRGRLNQDRAWVIKRQINEVLPEIQVLIFDESAELVVVRKTRTKTLVRAMRQR